MELSKTVYALIGVLIAVLVVATVAIPAITDLQAKEADVLNNGSTYSYHADLGDEFELSKAASSTTVYVNGVAFTPKPIDNYLLLTDNVCIVYETSNNIVLVTESVNATITSADKFTASIDGTTLTYAINDVAATVSDVSAGYVVAVEGDYVVANISAISTKTYVNNVNDISFGYYSSTLDESIIFFEGNNIFDSVAVEISLVPVDGYLNLSTVSSAGIVVSSGDLTETVRYVIVPAEIIGTLDTPTNALIGVIIPILLLVPIIAIIRMISGRGD